MIQGDVVEAPRMEQNKYTQYLLLKVRTIDAYVDKNQQAKQDIEIHEVRVFGQLGRMLSETTHQGDTILVEGALKSFDKQFYINVKSIKTTMKADGSMPSNDVDRRMPQRKPSPYDVNNFIMDLSEINNI